MRQQMAKRKTSGKVDAKLARDMRSLAECEPCEPQISAEQSRSMEDRQALSYILERQGIGTVLTWLGAWL